jgi:hypothetical protein
MVRRINMISCSIGSMESRLPNARKTVREKEKMVKRAPTSVQADGNQNVKDSCMMVGAEAKFSTDSEKKVPGDCPEEKRRRQRAKGRAIPLRW